MADVEMNEPAPIFAVNERCLCYHGPLVYEAKILKVNPQPEPDTLYQVHYKGWKQTWDEWVTAVRLLKFNETNIALQKKLMQTAQAKDNKEKESGKGKGPSKPGDATQAGSSVSASGTAHGSTRTGHRKDGARGTKRAREDVRPAFPIALCT